MTDLHEMNNRMEFFFFSFQIVNDVDHSDRIITKYVVESSCAWSKMTFQWPWPKEVKYSKLQGDGCASEEPKSRVKSVRQFMRSHSLEIVVALLLTNAVAVIVLALTGAMWWNATSRIALDSPLPNCELVLGGSSR